MNTQITINVTLMLLGLNLIISEAIGARISTTAAVRERRAKLQRQSNSKLKLTPIEKLQCNEKERIDLDNSIGQLLGRSKFPETIPEYRGVCNRAINYIKYADGYTKKCMPPLGAKIAAVILYTAKSQAKALCKSGKVPKKARELLKAAPCGNAARAGIEKCVDNITDALSGIAQFAPDKKKIPMACCNFHRMKECLRTEAEEQKICTRATVDYVERYAMEAIQPILSLLCYEYEEGSDVCAKLVQQTPQRDLTKRRAKSPLLPAIDLVLSFKDDDIL